MSHNHFETHSFEEFHNPRTGDHVRTCMRCGYTLPNQEWEYMRRNQVDGIATCESVKMVLSDAIPNFGTHAFAVAVAGAGVAFRCRDCGVTVDYDTVRAPGQLKVCHGDNRDGSALMTIFEQELSVRVAHMRHRTGAQLPDE